MDNLQINNENIIVQAKTKWSFSKNTIIFISVYFAVIVLSLIIGLTAFNDSKMMENSWNVRYGQRDNYSWFNLPIREERIYDSGKVDITVYSSSVTAIVFIYLILTLIPALIILNCWFCSKVTSLTVDNEKVYGTYRIFFIKKILNMPLKKVDTLTYERNVMDVVIRGGNTLVILSNSGKIKLHYVQNASEVVDKTLEQIKIVNNIEQNHIIKKDAANSSILEKMKQLTEMKNAGIITNEEFETKKKDLISKM